MEEPKLSTESKEITEIDVEMKKIYIDEDFIYTYLTEMGLEQDTLKFNFLEADKRNFSHIPDEETISFIIVKTMKNFAESASKMRSLVSSSSALIDNGNVEVQDGDDLNINIIVLK